MTNRAPTLRTETLTERRLKRQLRRFITAYHRAANHILSTHPKSRDGFLPWALKCEIEMIPISRGVADNIDDMIEHRLGMLCVEIRLMIEDARRQETLNPWDCLRLVERCKSRLNATRRDKE